MLGILGAMIGRETKVLSLRGRGSTQLKIEVALIIWSNFKHYYKIEDVQILVNLGILVSEEEKNSGSVPNTFQARHN